MSGRPGRRVAVGRVRKGGKIRAGGGYRQALIGGEWPVRAAIISVGLKRLAPCTVNTYRPRCSADSREAERPTAPKP